jgi:hypothetical protein
MIIFLALGEQLDLSSAGEERLASGSCDTQRGQASTFLEVEARFGFYCCPKAYACGSATPSSLARSLLAWAVTTRNEF